jgi:multiple sugar transport system ATP-binding protein
MGSVKLEHVYKKYDDKHYAVADVNVEIQNKEFVVLVGPSGCGKSTTLRMIAGLEEISEGKIFIDNILVNDVPPKDRDIAMVFQNYALYPHMTVFENLAFGLKMRRYPNDEIRRRVHQAAEILGIKEFLDRKPKALSGGQRQRVALGRAIVRRPKVFLFDEPLSNLDANLRVQMRTEISRLHKQLETTMIYVTHDQIEAMSMGDRIVVMKDGIVQQIDTPLAIYNKPANKFVAGFIGSPTMNFFSGRIIQSNTLMFQRNSEDFVLPINPQDGARVESYTNKELILGIRPEHITAASQNSHSQKVSVQVVVREPVGNEIFIYFTIGKVPDQYVSRIAATVDVPINASFDLFFDTSKFHFFDAVTGNSL